MSRDIKDRTGRSIGQAVDRGDRIEYFVYGKKGGLVGIYYKQREEYVAYGLGGNGLIARSDIGAGLVLQIWLEHNR